jgi:hypothetical protein
MELDHILMVQGFSLKQEAILITLFFQLVIIGELILIPGKIQQV